MGLTQMVEYLVANRVMARGYLRLKHHDCRGLRGEPALRLALLRAMKEAGTLDDL